METPEEFYQSSNLFIDTRKEVFEFAEKYADHINMFPREILKELKRGEELHPQYPKCIFRRIAIVNEEAGEATRAVLHYDYENGSLEDVKKELIQTAATCLRMLKNI